MAAYTIVNELQSIEFHDSFLNQISIEAIDLHMVFKDAIIMGHSRLDIAGRIPCSVNSEEDRYACPELNVTVKNFTLHSVLRGGCWAKNAQGNTIEKYSPRTLLPEEHAEFLKMVFSEKYNHVYGITYDAKTKRYTLSFFMNADANYYEVDFSSDTIIAEFEEFGKDAWYIDRR